MALTTTLAITVPVISFVIGGKQQGRVIVAGLAIRATVPIVIAPAVTLRALPRAVPFTTPLPLAFPATIPLPSTIFTSVYTILTILTLITMASF